MQDAIIMYENGKAIGGEGHPTNASDITFDNTGTDIVANKVGSAIKEVNEKTKHGIVELWKNSNIGANFAGQTITIANYDTTKYDAVQLSMSLSRNESYAPKVYEIDTDLITNGSTIYFTDLYFDNSASTIFVVRTATFTITGTTLSIAFSDSQYRKAGTQYTTDNGQMIPNRILGLIHND